MNKINILRMSAENVNLFNDGKFDFDLLNKIQVSNFNEDHAYYNLTSSIYLPKTVVIKGVNAPGKTTILKMIDLLSKVYLEGVKLNDNNISYYLDIFYNDIPLVFTYYFSVDNKLYKTKSKIGLTKQANSINQRYVFLNEKIYEKSLTSSMSKSSIYEDDYKMIYERKKLETITTTFLSDDKSINEMIVKGNSFFLDTHLQMEKPSFGRTNSVNQRLIKSFDPAIISFLDPSIKYIEPQYSVNIGLPTNSQNNILYNLHFSNGKKMEVSPLQLENMLSSGTLRGLKLLSNIKEILKHGGFLLIDELELHLNKTIIIDIIRLFKTNETNPKNATLIFTTHYSEILDIFDRNDQIYFSHRNNNYELMLSNFSDYNKLNLLKKSDYYFADSYDLGTSIPYEKYMALRKSFKDQHNDWIQRSDGALYMRRNIWKGTNRTTFRKKPIIL